MKYAILLVSLLGLNLLGKNSFSQTNFELPQDIKLETAGDYARYEKDIIAAAKWLEDTDLNKEEAKRKQINEFVLVWITGNPGTSLTLYEKLLSLYDKNTQLLTIYMASYSSKWILDMDKANEFNSIKAGLQSIIKVYKKNIGIVKNKEMNKLVKLSDTQLDKYIRDNFKPVK